MQSVQMNCDYKRMGILWRAKVPVRHSTLTTIAAEEHSQLLQLARLHSGQSTIQQFSNGHVLMLIVMRMTTPLALILANQLALPRAIPLHSAPEKLNLCVTEVIDLTIIK